MTGTSRRRVIHGAVAASLALLPEVALACPVCFGDPSSPMTHGLNNGIVVLLGVVFLVQAGFVSFFWRLRRTAFAEGRDAQSASGTPRLVTLGGTNRQVPDALCASLPCERSERHAPVSPDGAHLARVEGS